MAKSHTVGTVRSLIFLNSLLLVGAFSVPAYGQIETVTVTAERKSADIQTVPVSVTALTSKDLKAKQVTNFRDLQFHVPSVTYTKSNFGGAQFQIRGITTQFGLGAAVAQNIDDVYLEAPNLVAGEYYDVDRVEVLRGPQSTSYGRAATGGAVNIITTKPDLDDFAARAQVDYGSFMTVKPDAMINVPIIDGQLGVRFAVHGSFHNGYEKNIYSQLTNAQVDNTLVMPGTTVGQTSDYFAGSRIGKAENRGNSLGLVAGRFSTRWQPSDDTTIDLVADVSFENDRRVRGDKQMCHYDPAGVIGCLPDSLKFEGFNTAATLGTSLGSAQGIAAALSGALSIGPIVSGAGLPGGPPGAGGAGGTSSPASLLPTPLDLSAAQLIGNTVGLCSIAGNGASGDPNRGPGGVNGESFLGSRLVPSGPGTFTVTSQMPEEVGGPCTGKFGNGGGGGFVSQDILTTNTAFNPKYKTYGGTYLVNWSQTITDWLKMTVDGGFADGYAFTQQDFTDATHEDISPEISAAQSGFNIVFGGGGYTGLGGTSSGSLTTSLTALCGTLPPALQAGCLAGIGGAGGVVPGFSAGAIASNGAQYDAVYFDQPGQLPVSNVHYSSNRFGNYGGIIDTSHCSGSPKGSGPGPFPSNCGILIKSPAVISYDEDWFYSKEWTGEARFQTSFKGPLNFSAGLFYMDFVSENQYWVAANSLDWESAVLGAFLTPCNMGTCSTTPYLLAMPTFDAEYRRGLVESRSGFLEGTYEVTDELKVIAGARYNDDRDSYLRATKCAGGGLFAVNAANPMPDAGGPCDNTQFIQPDPGAPTASDPNCVKANGSCNHDVNFPAGLTSLYPIGSTNVFLPTNTRVPTFLLPKKGAQVTDLWTGRVSINWTPKLDFTDQTFVYFTASKGELAGGVNAPNNAAQTIVPVVYKPAEVNALELGVKNTLLDNTLTANLTAWYYNYQNYQVVVIANRQALELNIPAHLDGLEGEFLWQPTEDLAFNLTLSATQSAAGHVHLADERNPTNNDAKDGAILVRDITNGSICVVVPTNPALIGKTPGDSDNSVHVDNFYLPNGGNSAVDAGFGIPLTNYGLCGGQGSAAQLALENKGFDYTEAVNPRTGTLDPLNRDGTGIARDLHGNRLPQIPFGQVGIGAQYTLHWDEFNFVPRVDYYWQSSMESRVWNDPVIDRIGAWDVMNMSLNLNETDSKWTFQIFAKNVFDKHNPTGQYLQDPAAGTYTNVFSEDPRFVGFSIGDTF